MTKVFIDANIVIYFFDPASPLHSQAVDFLSNLPLRNAHGVLSPYVLNEIHYHYLKKYSPQLANQRISYFMSLPHMTLADISLTMNDLKNVFSLSEKYRLKTFDAFHAYYCKKLGIKKIATFDEDFDRVTFLKRVTSPS